MIHHLVHLGISPAEKAIRTVAVYLALLVLLHLSGKRSIAQLNSFDLVVLLLLSNVVQNAIIGNDNSLARRPARRGDPDRARTTRSSALAFMSPRFGKAIQGGSTVVATDGQGRRDELRKLAITHEEFIAGLRRQGLELEDTELVTLEPEGIFNATPSRSRRSRT